jgi:hypothetical protein
VLGITVEQCIHAGRAQRAEIFDLDGRIALNAHSAGLSVGTDAPLLKYQQGARQCLRFIPR